MTAMRRHRPPTSVYLTSDAISDLWRSNRHADRHRTSGLALLYGKRRPRTTVTVVITKADTTAERRAKEERVRREGLVLLGESRAVTETCAHKSTRKPGDNPLLFLGPPPVGHLFLLRHRLGLRNKFYATTYDGTGATQVPIHLTK
jgi:hypothetical protein